MAGPTRREEYFYTQDLHPAVRKYCECPVCRDPLVAPVVLPCHTEHVLCEACCNGLARAECPLCRKPFAHRQVKLEDNNVRRDMLVRRRASAWEQMVCV